jgi:poly(A) polymerase
MVCQALEELILSSKIECYAVGGVLRDIFLGRPISDLDLLVKTGALQMARELADRTGGNFVLLDAQHNVGRVVLSQQTKIPSQEVHPFGIMVIDIAEFSGVTLEEDLASRDFTINAMALTLTQETLSHLTLLLSQHPNQPHNQLWLHTREQLRAHTIDPCGGMEDIQSQIIRAPAPEVFQQDPLRMLRGLRFSCQLGWPLEATTQQWLQACPETINVVSGERIRDEIFVMLRQNQAAACIQGDVQKGGIFTTIWPEILVMAATEQNHHHAVDVWLHCLTTLVVMERMLANPGEFPAELSKPLFIQLQKGLGRSPRRRLELLKWAALFHDVGKTVTRGRRLDGRITFYGHDQAGVQLISAMAGRLALSKKETLLVERLVALHMRPLQLYTLKQATPKARFRLFRELGAEAIEVLLLALADLEAKVTFRGSQEESVDYQKFIFDLLQDYINRPVQIFPPRLITGTDIITRFPHCTPKSIGALLDEVYEAQGAGEITTRAEALDWLEERHKDYLN